MTVLNRLPPIRHAAIAALGILGGCTLPHAAATPVEAVPAPLVVDEITGAGICYPPATSFEIPQIRFERMAGVGEQQRQVFVDQINLAASTPGRTVPIVAQAVGHDRGSLVFMYVQNETGITSYLARGLLARLTSITRSAPLIMDMDLSTEFDIYNAAAVLGFERIVVTDGRHFSHEVKLSGD